MFSLRILKKVEPEFLGDVYCFLRFLLWTQMWDLFPIILLFVCKYRETNQQLINNDNNNMFAKK